MKENCSLKFLLQSLSFTRGRSLAVPLKVSGHFLTFGDDMVSFSLVENKLLTATEMAKQTIFKEKRIYAFKAKRFLCDLSTFSGGIKAKILMFTKRRFP